MNKAYATATLTRLLAIALNAVGALLLLPFVLKALGEYEFGIWAMATAITGYLLLLDFGIALACTRYLSIQQEPQAWRRTLSSAWFLSLVLAGLLLLVAVALQIAVIFNLLPASYQPMPDVISLLLLEVAVTIPLRLFQSVLRAQMRYTTIGVLEVLRIVLRLLGIPLLLWAGGGLMTILVYASIINVLFFALMMADVYRREGTLFLSRRARDGRHVRELLHFSKYTAISQVAEFFKYRTDNVLVGLLLGISAVAPYAMLVVIIDMLTQILMRFQSYWDTQIMGYVGKQHFARALEATLTSLAIGVALALLATFNSWLLAEWFFRLWVGERYTYLAVPLTLFTLILLGVAVQLATTPYFNALEHQRTNAGLALAEIVLKLVLVVPLSYVWGSNGVIVAGIVATLLVAGLRLRLLAQLVGCHVGMMLSLVVQPLVPLASLLAALTSMAWLLPHLGVTQGWSVFLVLALQLMGLIYLLKNTQKTHHQPLSAIHPGTPT